MRSEPTAEAEGAAERPIITVEVRATGHVRDAMGTHRFEFAFEGDTLREFLDALFEGYDVRDLLIAETEAEATSDPPGGRRSGPAFGTDARNRDRAVPCVG